MNRLSSLSLVVALSTATSLAHAQAPSSPPAEGAGRAEARERFARALRLFNESDNAAALAEYQRVYEIVPSAVVLYNIGLVYAAMGRPVEAVDAFDRLLKSPASLTPEQLARATATRAAQVDRVAEIVVKANVEGAAIEVDSLEVARAPLKAPLKVASGTHVVAAVLPGYVPVRKSVSVAGHAQAEVSLELVPMQGRLAHLVVQSSLPGAEILVDGQVAGETPLPSSLSLAPGRHRVELRRVGYVMTGQDVVLGDAATGELTIDPEEDPVLAPLDGTLTLVLRETAAVVTVDGKRRGAYTGPLHLPGGKHQLRVERSGFFVAEREIVVPAEGAVSIAINLEPTPDTLATFTSSVKARTTWSVVGIVSGTVFAIAGAGVLAYDASQRSTEQTTYNNLTGELATHSGPCFFGKGGTTSQCYGPINSAAQSYNAALTRDALGYTFLGIGVVALATSTVVLLTSEGRHRYDKKATTETLGTLHLGPVNVAVGGSGAAFQGAF
jgi:hypothetical protein